MTDFHPQHGVSIFRVLLESEAIQEKLTLLGTYTEGFMEGSGVGVKSSLRSEITMGGVRSLPNYSHIT